MNAPLPAGIETVFLDAGNTLIGMDYARIARELAAHGIAPSVGDLARAEAAARPHVSEHVAAQARQSGLDAFVFYFARIVERLPSAAGIGADVLEPIVRDVAAALKRPGEDHRLWCTVIDGVPAALDALADAGYRLVVVSNSDGSVERALVDLGLADRIDAILDSEIVGFEKPDPRFFSHALRIAGTPPDRTLHVGDMYFQDVLGARSAGIECVLLDPHDDWAGADCLRRRDLAAVARELVAMRRGS